MNDTLERRTIGHSVPRPVVVIDLDGDTAYRLADGTIALPCWKCDTEPVPGTIASFGFMHEGVCYGCNGAGHGKTFANVEDALRYTLRRDRAAERRAQKRAEDEAQRLAALTAERDAWRTEHADLMTALAPWLTRDPRTSYERALHSMARDVHESNLTLTDGEVAHAATMLTAVAERDAANATATLLGTEGEKVTVTGTVAAVRSVPLRYGSKMLVRVQAGTATVFTFTTAAWAWGIAEGDTVTLAGTVKAHSTYQGTPQTEIARPRLVQP